MVAQVVISALKGESGTSEAQGLHQVCREFEASLGYKRFCLQKKRHNERKKGRIEERREEEKEERGKTLKGNAEV